MSILTPDILKLQLDSILTTELPVTEFRYSEFVGDWDIYLLTSPKTSILGNVAWKQPNMIIYGKGVRNYLRWRFAWENYKWIIK